MMVFAISSGSIFGQKVKRTRNVKEMNEFADQWLEGEVTYKNGKTILCELSYNPLVPEGLVKIADGNRILTETAYSLESFSFYNSYDASDRTYYSLKIGSRQRAFIELLYESPSYSILGRREIGFIKHHSEAPHESHSHSILGKREINHKKRYWERYFHSGMIGGEGRQRTKLEKHYQRYYFDMETGELQALDREKVIELTEGKKKEIKQFIRDNKLRFNDTVSYISVLDEYHRLTKQSAQF